MTIETGDSVSLEYVGTLPDGTALSMLRQDVTEAEGLAEAQPDRDYEPLAIEVGTGTVIEGFDETLIGMSVGDEESIEIPPGKAYDEHNEDLVREHETEQLREVLGDEPKKSLYVQTQQGGLGGIVHTGDDVVCIDFSHELVGETLIFDVEVLDAN